MKRILLFSHDPGGANTVIPLVRPLNRKGFQVRLVGKGPALERYAIAGLDAEPITNHLKEFTTKSISSFLAQEKPEFIITGTSAEDDTEKLIWKAAEAMGIPSIAILDQWLNYGIRFSPWRLSENDAYRRYPEHPFLPSLVVVMDEFAKEEMSRERILPAERIRPLGQPHFQDLANRLTRLPSANLLRESLGIHGNDFVITFVSEPLSSDYDDDPELGEYWGFTERTTFRTLRQALERTANRTGKKVHLRVKLHPRERLDNLTDLIVSSAGVVTVAIEQQAGPLELIQVSDLICGMSSMMLVEAAILSRPVLSILLNLKRESPFVLDRRGIIRSARTEAELEEYLLLAFKGNSAGLGRFEVMPNPVEAIIEEVEGMLA